MKKVVNTLSALLLIQVAAYAQQPANRTSATKIADVLAQQPAEEINKFTAAMKELQNFTAEDVANLLAGLKPQGGNMRRRNMRLIPIPFMLCSLVWRRSAKSFLKDCYWRWIGCKTKIIKALYYN